MKGDLNREMERWGFSPTGNCHCGCGGITRGRGSYFSPGHDARLTVNLLEALRGSSQVMTALQDLATAPAVFQIGDIKLDPDWRLKEAQKNNVWTYDPVVLVLRYDDGVNEYEVDLERMSTAFGVLDWIVQVSEKVWVTPRALGDLVRLLDAVLNFRANYRS